MGIYERKSISMSCTSVNRPNKRVEVENILHLIFHMQFSCILNPFGRRRSAETLTILVLYKYLIVNELKFVKLIAN